MILGGAHQRISLERSETMFHDSPQHAHKLGDPDADEHRIDECASVLPSSLRSQASPRT